MSEDRIHTIDPDIVRDGEHEYRRLKKKVRDYVKNNLREYIFDGGILGRRGKKFVKIPITGIRLPSFERDKKRSGGVGQGPGQQGDALPGQRPKGNDNGAGKDHEEHAVEVEIVVDEILEILQEALELPNIEDKGKRKVISEDVEWSERRKTGPECLLDIKRTIKNTLARILAGMEYSPDKCPPLVIDREDRVFKSWKEITEEKTNAVVFAIMDISGSMGVEEKKIVATAMYWIEEWLKKQYKDGIEVVHIVHDTEAWEVSYSDFYSMATGGGTSISPALKLCDEIIDKRFPHHTWNIYPFFFSDGDNQSDDDSEVVNVLKNALIPKSNQICYGQIQSSWGSGKLYQHLLENLGNCEKLCVYQMKGHEDILGAIKKFLGRGR